jgi:O-antigen chain-terminating methyltransferase
MLKENGVPAVGIDRNAFFLQICRERGCDVVDADLLQFLRAQPADSLSAVTSFHVIEHLPMPVLQEMLSHIFRTLKSGGVAILETPNPSNVLTSSLNFLLDPTHLRPIHPAFAQFLLESRGFASVKVDYLHPYDPSYHVGETTDPLAQRFNEYFYGPQDYVVIAIKP